MTGQDAAHPSAKTVARERAGLQENQPPRVSIGLPVYNGGPYLRETLESILAQTFTDFELIISDNASTDQTEKICREYATKDKRIRYFRNQTNLGAAANYNRAFELSRGEYFKWAAADDVCAPEFLARCVAALDRDSAAVLACTHVIDIDEEGRPLRTKAPLAEAASTKPCVRFRRLVRLDYTCEEIFGLGRTCVLRQTNLIAKYADSDRVLLSQLGLWGPFTLIPEALLLHRIHAKNLTQVHRTRRCQLVWFDPSAKRRIVFPFWREFIEFCRVIARSPLPRQERRRCYGIMARWAREYKQWLARDLFYYVKQFVALYVPGAKAAWSWVKTLRAKNVAEEF